MLTTPSSTVISIKCRLLRHSDSWVPVWDKDLNEKAAGIRFVSEENVTVSGKAAAASKVTRDLTFKGCPKSPAFKDKAHILLASLNIPNKNCCGKLRDGACFFPTWRCHDDPWTRLLQCILIKINMLSLGFHSRLVSASQRCPCG